MYAALSNAVYGDTSAAAAGTPTSPPSARKQRRTSSHSSTGSTPSTTTEKYMLRVTAGPSYDAKTHKLVMVNGEEACSFENEFMSASVKVRVKDFNGLPRSCPPSHPYFDHPTHTYDRYSISFSFTPKVDIPSHGTVWGNDFPDPIRDRLPPGFNTAFNIVKRWIDPGLECDAYADQPWLLGPALSCWFTFFIGDKSTDATSPSTTTSFSTSSPTSIIEEGGTTSGLAMRKSLALPDTGPARRKWALTPSHRDSVTFEAGREYRADFFNPYLDFSNFSLKLPGFSLNVLRYIDDKTHKLRYVFKNRETGDVYFVVVFSLLYGEELMEALEWDREEGEGKKEKIGGSKEKSKAAGTTAGTNAAGNDDVFHDDDVD